MLKEFVDKHSLRVKRSPDDGTDNIVGRVGEIYEYSDCELALMICRGSVGIGRWARVRKKCVAAGMTLRQNGDDEGALSFNPANPKQAALVIKVIGARRKRQLSARSTGQDSWLPTSTRVSPHRHGSKWAFKGQNRPSN